MKKIKIQASDTLFFRGAKPFSMGEESVAETMYIPNPTVFWGAIYSKLISEGKIKENNGSYDKEILRLGRVFLYNEKTTSLFLPAPADIFKDKEGNVYTEQYKSVDKIMISDNISSNYIVKPVKNKNVTRDKNQFIDIISIRYYLQQLDNNIIIYGIDEIIELETKIGIKRENSTQTVKENNLYRVPMLRFKEDWSFIVEYELEKNINLSENGIIKLGGEGKTAYYSKIDIKSDIQNSTNIEEGEFFKIYLSSSMLFNNNDLKFLKNKDSGIVDWATTMNSIFNNGIKFWSLANFQPVQVGGWDLKARKPKIMKMVLPAGSVFMFKSENNISKNKIRKLFSEITDKDTTKFGFNQFEILS